MNGGMSRRLDGLTLAERSARSRVGQDAVDQDRSGPVALVEGARPRPTVARHCWVRTAPLAPIGRTAALLVQWERHEDGLWVGRVVYAVESVDGTDRPIVVDTWLPSSLLEPS